MLIQQLFHQSTSVGIAQTVSEASFKGFRTALAQHIMTALADPSFQSWFGASTLKRGDKAILFYHGTAHAFTRFDVKQWGRGMSDEDDPVGFYFTTSAKMAARYAEGRGRIVPAFLRVTHPYTVTARQWALADGLSPREAMDAGHDAMIIAGQEGGTTVIVFDPDNIWQVAFT